MALKHVVSVNHLAFVESIGKINLVTDSHQAARLSSDQAADVVKSLLASRPEAIITVLPSAFKD